MKSGCYSAYLAHSKKTLSLVLSTCLLWTSSNWVEAVEPRAERPIAYELAPPPSLGWVVDYYDAPAETSGQRNSGLTKRRVNETAGSQQRLVILIQDLHAHYGVQKNIAGILEFLSKKLSNP